MRKVGVHFENCYGIRAMDAEFDFSNKAASIIYASNGTMKTSFARTFKDHSEGKDSKDQIYSDRVTIRKITDENGDPLPKEVIFVIEPYDSSYESNRVSTLLANGSLKSEYDEILREIDRKASELMKLLRTTSGVKSGLEDIISKVFTKMPGNLLRAFDRIKNEVYEGGEDLALSDIKFATLFNDKIENLLDEESVKEALEQYTTNYEALLDKSRFFRKGIFNHYQAGEIARQLKNHGFFQANHKVFLNSSDGDTKVETEAELEALINEELASILSDESLKASFDKIDRKLSNKELRAFREFLLGNQTLIPRLQTPELLKEDLLKSYLMRHRLEFESLMSEYEVGKKRIDEITKKASEEATKWQEVINIYNRRFSVPFKVVIENKQDVILKRVTPNISFIFKEKSAASVPVKRSDLVNILSSGERRALYILNIIFEVEARATEGIQTLFIVDDIADSFDYKNKYAIVEYLNDILAEGDFRQIILTHNYDFYRTVWRRLNLGGANFHISKSSDKITLTKEQMYRDPFEKWTSSADEADKTDMLIAMIPFVRNLAEYCGYREESLLLTKLLHIKSNSHELLVKNLLEVFCKILKGKNFSSELDNTQPVISLIYRVANRISCETESSPDLEKKIVLSIAIRLRAEQYMIDVIDDPDWVESINKNQTGKLVKRFKEDVVNKCEEHAELVDLMERVNLMTPENIHLNSFMYEPILDMASEHLSKLYKELETVSPSP
ncbi:MAG: hypothetical protein OXE97_13310 [Gammaproteobacteria bacterium]|nr:hypothetical protein [Gammaproteobacteria bacterium]